MKVIALAGVLGGCAMLSFGGEMRLSVMGLFYGLGTGLVLAFYNVVSKAAGKNYPSETVTFYMFLFSAFVSFFIAAAWNIPTKITDAPTSIWYFVGFAALPTILAYALYTIGLKTVSAGKASMLSTGEIVVATIVGLTVFNDDIGVMGYIGMVLTVSSLVFLEFGDVRSRHNKLSETKLE